jgi:hypothetical protein
VTVEGFGIVFLIVAEDRPALLQPAAVADQPIPVVVSDFVAEVA